MHPRHFVVAIFMGLLLLMSNVHAGTIPSGYEKLSWGAEFTQVSKKYPRGQLAKLGSEVIYKQQKPTKMIARRNFAFSNGRLHAITIAFEKRYIESKGIEQLLGEQKQSFGEGHMDRSQAPHMIRYIWEGADTKITFAYAPKRPDMTMIMYEQKGSAAAVDSGR